MKKRSVLIAVPDERAGADLVRLVEHLGLEPATVHTRSQASAAMERKPADVVLLDVRAKELEPEALLVDLARRWPQAQLVACAQGGMKGDVVVALRGGCLDWIDLPTDRAALAEALKRCARVVRRQAAQSTAGPTPQQARGMIRELVGRIRDGSLMLPEMPRIVEELRRLLSDLTVNSAEVLRVLEKDPGMAARIITASNTATYGGRGRITDLRSAVTRLGNRTIASIAQTAALRGMFSFKSPAFRQVFQQMWTGHLVAAHLARELATEVGESDPEELYLLSLLHNSGEQFLLRVFAELFLRQSNQVLSMDEVLGVIRDYHGIFGAGLLRKWNMGEQFELVARLHHEEDFETVEPGLRRRMHVVNLADRLVELRGLGIYPQPTPGPDADDSFRALGIRDDRRPELIGRVDLLREDVVAGGV